VRHRQTDKSRTRNENQSEAHYSCAPGDVVYVAQRGFDQAQDLITPRDPPSPSSLFNLLHCNWMAMTGHKKMWASRENSQSVFKTSSQVALTKWKCD